MSKNKSFRYSNLEVENEWPSVGEWSPSTQQCRGILALELLPISISCGGLYLLICSLSTCTLLVDFVFPEFCLKHIHTAYKIRFTFMSLVVQASDLAALFILSLAWIWLQRLSYQPSSIPVCMPPSLTGLGHRDAYLSFLWTWLCLSVRVILGIYSC